MNKYSDLSDFEINKRVAVAWGYTENWIEKNPENVSDYCNSWADGGAIIEEYDITIINPSSAPAAINYDSSISSHADRPLRAAAEVFLMMKENNDE